MSDTSPQTPQPARSPRLSRRRSAANFLSIAGTNVLGPVVTVLISVYVRRALGPEAIGQVSWAMAVVAHLSAMVSLGLAFVGQRALAQSPERAGSLAALVLTLQTLLACAVYALVLVIAALEPRGPRRVAGRHPEFFPPTFSPGAAGDAPPLPAPAIDGRRLASLAGWRDICAPLWSAKSRQIEMAAPSQRPPPQAGRGEDR